MAIPIAAVILGEAVRYVLTPDANDLAAHVMWGAIAVAAIVLFALSMFWSIGRAEREIVRQNSELGAVNAVSKAVQDQRSTQGVIAAALQSVVSTTNATSASVRVFPVDGEAVSDPIVFEADPSPSREPRPLPVELPLTTGSAVVGLLQVWLPAAESDQRVSAAALQNISHQLGCAIQLRRLVDDLERRQHEATALYDVAILISDQHSLADTLSHMTRTIRDLLAVDDVALCLTPAASDIVAGSRSADSGSVGSIPRASDGAVCVTPDSEGLRPAHDHRTVCPRRSAPEFQHVLEVPIRSPDATLGDIWVGRQSSRSFDPADRALLTGLADLASIAITSARLRERERLAATVAERERIARELHDSLAQVLGVTHLRLRAMGANPVIEGAPEVLAEVTELADLTHEAFQDVREAILGLREASRLSRGFVASLAAYLDKFSRQSGIEVNFDARLGLDPDMGPGAEIQVIRVIQEALANVRKHAGASSAVVRMTDHPRTTTLEIEDDGRGFDVGRTLSEQEDGFGLQTMRERMELIGGSLTVHSVTGHGTRVVARIPKESRQSQRGGGTRATEAIAPGAGGR